MREVYSPSNSVEAHMLAHLLDQSGIKAHIHGEALQLAAGDLPAAGLVRLMVEDADYEKARALLLAWEKQIAPSEAGEAYRWRFPFVSSLCSLLVGVIVGMGVANFATSMTGAQNEFDRNGDGRTDLTYFYPPNRDYAMRSEGDNNFDGGIDEVFVFDSGGLTERQQVDQDFDGRLETVSTFRDGVLWSTEIDSDDNRVADHTFGYEDGVLKLETIIDPGVGRVARVNHYVGGFVQYAEFDENRDGFLETVRTYDRYGGVLSTQTRTR